MPDQYQHRTKEELVAENLQLKSELAELKRLIFGRKSEGFVADQVTTEQLNLFVQHDEQETQDKTVKEVVGPYERNKGPKRPRRLKLPDDLPVVEIEILPEAGLIQGWVRIGQEITEELDFVPGRFRIIRYIRPKYARPKAEQEQDPDGKNIIIAPLPTRVIEKGIPSAALLAYLLISKFVDHLPYYRQIKIFERIGMKISASTINGWVKRCVALLKVLYEWHKLRLMDQNYLMADETTIKVLDGRKKGKAHTGYFWVYYDPGGKQALFIYNPGRAGKYPREDLKAFKGHLQTDGYAAYDAFDQEGSGITLVGCMAHLRRKFEQALGNDPQRATYVLKRIQPLYDLERQAREQNHSSDQRLALRKEKARPLMDQLKTWLLQQKNQIVPKSKIGQAVGYALNRWKYVERYLEDGKLEIDNNLVENAIRPVAIGRKNYLFAGSPQGAEWAAVIYSLLASASNCGHNPQQYLQDVLLRLPDQPLTALDDLLPLNWKPLNTAITRAQK